MKPIYGLFREGGFPTIYPEIKTAVYNDLLIYGLIFCFSILGFSFLVVIPGVRGIQRLYVTIRIFVSLLIGAFILVANFGQEWEKGSVRTWTQYKAFTDKSVHVDLKVKIGLRSVNITMVEVPKKKNMSDLQDKVDKDIINYNERFSWEWAQGRNGFGPQAGRIQREFRAAQTKGLPYPILWIAEYFTFDGEGLRWGRHYRTAGWYSHVMMWLAFPLWLLANILFCMVIKYGAYFLLLTGSSLLSANVLFASIRNFNELEIKFDGGWIRMTYGWSFHLTLFTGLFCVFLGIIIFILADKNSEFAAIFFGNEILSDTEDFYANAGDQIESPGTSNKETETYGLRRRTLTFDIPLPTRKSMPSTPFKSKLLEEGAHYENTEMSRIETISEEDIQQSGIGMVNAASQEVIMEVKE